jgi:ribosomal protein S18 acetylase RimI-like enzyme
MESMKREGGSGEIVFRLFADGDMCRCSEMCAQAWPEIHSVAPAGDGQIAMQAIVEFDRASATWQEVACVSGRIVGMLMGRVDRDVTPLGRLKAFIGEQLVYLKVFAGLYGKMSDRIELIRRGMSDDRAKARNSPEAGGEVTLFVVDKDHRGKGIGRMMMDRFIRYAKGRGAERITVYTNDPGCNWGFYEKYGFSHYSTFPDSFTSFTAKREVKALIFSIDL